MAYVCGKCLRVHPKGAVGCEDAARILEKRAREFEIKVAAHQEHCDCSDPEGHIRKREGELHRRKPVVFGKAL